MVDVSRLSGAGGPDMPVEGSSQQYPVGRIVRPYRNSRPPQGCQGTRDQGASLDEPF